MMEASSPLAAMQPPSFGGHGAFRPDAPAYASLVGPPSLGAGSFNFRDLSMRRSMQKPPPDYFSLQPVRGSSPTSSLAADLSQNFHIDQSPQLPTPRRALFSSNLFAARDRPASLTTPPIPTSSSPAGQDSMDLDVSPLPHKIPFGSHVEIRLQSPTPECTPSEAGSSTTGSIAVGRPIPMPLATKDAFQIQLPAERRKPGPLRPSLSKAKGFSTGHLPQRLSSEAAAAAAPFKFGNWMNKPATSSSLSLSEMFNESPVQEKPPPRLGAPAFPHPRARMGLGGGASNAARHGSPGGMHMRKGSNPLVRPRKQFRRSLSMFEHPDDVMRQDKEEVSPPPLLPSIMDVEAPHVPQLPHFTPEDENSALPRITRDTMVEILDGRFNHLYEKLVIIDCRFEYEYNGGHIEGAVNFNDKEELAAQLFDVEPTAKALLIFHCEYSAHRAPLMAKFIRNKDRAANVDHYPALTYPESYILDGGYSAFFKAYRARCFPQNYVEMDAKEHVMDCERGLGKVKQRSKLIRAQTFAFGQHASSLDSSPTAMCRGRPQADVDLDMGLMCPPAAPPRSSWDPLRGQNRRMLSY